jgi:hypothetical protein
MLSAVMNWIAPGSFNERMQEQFALRGLTGNHPGTDDVEILARIFLTPCGAARRQRLQPHGRARRVAGHASRISESLCGENRLNARLKEFEVERRRCRRRGLLNQ